MNEFEQKAFRYQELGNVLNTLESRQQYYMVMKTDENGDYVRGANGRYVYEEPTDEYDKERLAVYRKVIADFKAWALK